MDPFYLGIPHGPAIPPVERTGLAPIGRDQPHQRSPQEQEAEEQDEFAEEAELDELELEPLETYDDHGRLHELGVGDGGLPEGSSDAMLMLPAVSGDVEEASEEVAEPASDVAASAADRRRHDGDGHIDISV